MCLVDKTVREFKSIAGVGYRDVCQMDERYTDHEFPGRIRECCGSRSVASVGGLEEKYYSDDDYENGQGES